MKGIRNVDTLAGGTIFPPGQQAREYWFLTEDEKVTITIGNSDGKPHKQWFLTEDGLYEKLIQTIFVSALFLCLRADHYNVSVRSEP